MAVRYANAGSNGGLDTAVNNGLTMTFVSLVTFGCSTNAIDVIGFSGAVTVATVLSFSMAVAVLGAFGSSVVGTLLVSLVVRISFDG
jgi:hypothetical protein